MANFPVAGAIIWGVMTINSTYYLIITNHSPVALLEVHFFGPGYDLNIGTIPAAQNLKLKLHPVVSGESFSRGSRATNSAAARTALTMRPFPIDG